MAKKNTFRAKKAQVWVHFDVPQGERSSHAPSRIKGNTPRFYPLVWVPEIKYQSSSVKKGFESGREEQDAHRRFRRNSSEDCGRPRNHSEE